jgi:flavin-dependent dehydrogenase
VIRRDQFDEHLYKTATGKGVVTKHGEEVNEVIRTSQEVIIKTSKQEYSTKVLVGADGANSSIRQAVELHRMDRLMVAMEIITPLSSTDLPDLSDNMAIFDIRLTSRGVPGYCWIFPSLYESSRAVSLGIMAAPSRKSETVPVKTLFTEWVHDQGIDVRRVEPKAHPILRYEPHARSSSHRVLLTGDAAGIDPLFGEGIFSALALGRITAASLLEALKRSDFGFLDYEKRIRSSSIGSIMRRRRLLAKRLYAQPRLSQYLLQYGPLLKWIARLQLPQGKVSWESY